MPVFDEITSLEAVADAALATGRRVADRIQVLIVDDGSTDGSGELADRLAEMDGAVVALHHERNRGYGAALRTGLAAATGSWVFLCDSDGQFDLGELERAADLATSGDIVAGFRRSRADPWFRRLNARLYALFLRGLFGLRICDVDCAFKLISRSVLESVELSSNGAFLSAELLIRASHAGFTLRQIGVSHYPRRAGRPSGARPAVVLGMFPEAWRLWRELHARRL